MTLLVISPDYASHVLPLLAIAQAWRRRGWRVVVATGPAVAPMVREAGMEHTELIMSSGSNAGMRRTRTAIDEDARSLAAFYEATRGGMVETIRFQTAQRARDSLWRPRQVARKTARLVELYRPEAILIDHLAFAASIGLRATGARFGDVVVGHPTALPVDDEVYGVPKAWPVALSPNTIDLETLRAEARLVAAAFTRRYNDALHALAPAAPGVDDAFAAHGDLVLFDYPAELHAPARTDRLPRHVFIGSSVRFETPDDETRRWLARPDDRPLVVVSFGTFLSARTDVLAKVAGALHRLDVRVAMAIGAADREMLGELPPAWLVRPHLPQVTLLGHADLLVTHGGNNSVTEALTFGVPMLVMPFSTDQFDGAAAVERALAGVAIDPNRAPRSLIAGSIRGLLRNPPDAPAAIGTRLRREPGPEIAYAAMAGIEAWPGRRSSAPTSASLEAQVP